MTGTWHAAAGRRQALRAVSHADQSGITASTLSRRPEEMWCYAGSCSLPRPASSCALPVYRP